MGMQQVILKCRVMEVQRSKIRQLGMNFLYVNDNGFVGSTPGTLVPLSNSTANFTGNGAGGQGLEILNTALSSLSLAGGIVDDNNIFQTFLDALKQERLLKILAEPTLNTTNGRPAQMLAGGEFPIVVPQSLGTTTIEWREFGVRMEAVPTILGAGRVRLELQPEVSERDFSNSVNINGFTVPGLTTRRVNTQVEMKFHQSDESKLRHHFSSSESTLHSSGNKPHCKTQDDLQHHSRRRIAIAIASSSGHQSSLT